MTSAPPLFQLGDFQFSLPNGAPQSLDWSAEYRWEEQGRLLRDPALQFLGPGTQSITLDGVLFPGFSGRQSTMEQLRSVARQGQPLMFSDGTGRVYGKWAIKQVRESRSVFMAGGLARKIDFTVELGYYADDNPGLAASPLSTASGGLVGKLAAAASNTPVNFTEAGSAFDAISWSQAVQWQGLTQQATQAGFSLGQLATIANTGIGIATDVARGSYVNAALTAFGLTGFDATTAGGWAQVGINAANLAESYINGQGPTGMALALGVASQVGGQSLLAAGAITQQDLPVVNDLLKSTATLGTILEVDPKVTDMLRNSIVVP